MKFYEVVFTDKEEKGSYSKFVKTMKPLTKERAEEIFSSFMKEDNMCDKIYNIIEHDEETVIKFQNREYFEIHTITEGEIKP